MRFRRDGDDARRRRGLEAVQQQIGQQKRREVIDRKGQLEPVRRKPVLRRKQAGIVDQHVEPVVPGQNLVRQPAHLRETRKIGERHIDPVRARALDDPSPRLLGPRTVAAGHHDPHPGPRETQRGVQPDPGARPGHDCDQLRRIFGRRNHPRNALVHRFIQLMRLDVPSALSRRRPGSTFALGTGFRRCSGI